MKKKKKIACTKRLSNIVHGSLVLLFKAFQHYKLYMHYIDTQKKRKASEHTPR